MKFSELDARMRVFEEAPDSLLIPEIYVVVRLDGRSFTKLTKDVAQFEAPFDPAFRDLMIQTTEHLMTCGFKIIYGYTQSDEISILFSQDDELFSRKPRKILSVLAGEASAAFSIKFGKLGVFDARICQLPNLNLVVDYFRWRNEDANRNCLNSHCYWIQRKEGKSAKSATKVLLGMSVAEKNEFLFKRQINYNEIPLWQKRGSGLYWECYKKMGFNPKTKAETIAQRRRIKIDLELPMKDEYSKFIYKLIEKGV